MILHPQKIKLFHSIFTSFKQSGFQIELLNLWSGRWNWGLITMLWYSTLLHQSLHAGFAKNKNTLFNTNTVVKNCVIENTKFIETDTTKSSLEIHVISSNNIPIFNAEIFLEELHLRTFTNKSGVARFNNLNPGIYEVEISIDTLHFHTHLSTSEIHHFEIPLERLSLGDVNIVVHHTEIQSNSLQNLQSQSLNFSSTSITQNLRNIPMMNLVATGRTISKPIFQGNFGLRLPILVQGNRLEGQAWGTDHGPEVGAWGSEKAELLKGTQAISVGGDAWGNAINIQFAPQYHPFETDIKWYSGYQSNGGVIQSGAKWVQGEENGKGHYLVVNFQKSKDYSVPQGTLKNTAAEEFSIYGGHTLLSSWGKSVINYSAYHFKSGIYLGSHIGNVTDLLWNIQQETPTQLTSSPTYNISKPYQLGQQWMASWEQTYKRFTGTKTVITLQQNRRKEYDPHRNPLNTFPQLDVVLNTGTIQWLKTQQISNSKLHLGTSIQIQQQQWEGYFLVPDYWSWQGSVWGIFEPFPRKKMKNEFALRWDRIQRWVYLPQNQNDQNFFNGVSGGYSKEFTWEGWFQTIHITQSFRAPSVNELYSKGVHHGSAAYEEGNENLKSESGQKFEWQSQKSTKNWQWNLNSFAQHSSNYIFLTPQTQPIYSVRGAFPYYKYESMAVWFAGFNIQTKLTTPIGDWGCSYDFIYAKLYEIDRYPPQIPPQKIRATWSFKKNGFSALLEGNYVPKQRFFSADRDLMPAPNDYFILNASLGWIPNANHSHWECKLFVENATNSNYRDYLDRFRYFVPQPSRNWGVRVVYNLHHHRNHHNTI
jgi:iron complex outermembrane receptor protein